LHAKTVSVKIWGHSGMTLSSGPPGRNQPAERSDSHEDGGGEHLAAVPMKASFAGVLRDLGLPRTEFLTALVTFNAGVEAGQLSVGGVLAPQSVHLPALRDSAGVDCDCVDRSVLDDSTRAAINERPRVRL
jgi:hypothetical protein